MPEEQIKVLADALWGYFLEKYLKPYLSDSVCYYMATVTTAPGGGVIGVTRPYDTEVILPCAANASELAVGAPCMVLVFGDYSNQLVIGNPANLGGGGGGGGGASVSQNPVTNALTIS